MSEEKGRFERDKAAKMSALLGTFAVGLFPVVNVVYMFSYYDVWMYLPAVATLALYLIPMLLAVCACMLGWRGLKSNAKAWAIVGVVLGGSLVAFVVVITAWCVFGGFMRP